MSGAEKALGVIKTFMRVNERFDALDQRVKRLDRDMTDLSRSHAEVAQRVAVIEGYLRGRADQATNQSGTFTRISGVEK